MLKRCIGIIYLSMLMACANQVELASRPQSQELGVRQFKKYGDAEPTFYYCEHDSLDAWGCATPTPKTPHAGQQEQAYAPPDQQVASASVSATAKQDWEESSEASAAGRAKTTRERVRERIARLQSANGQEAGQPENNDLIPAGKQDADPIGSSELLATVYFDFDRYELTDEAKSILGPVRADKTLSQKRVLVLGYTDSFGGKRYNDELADRRARTVADYLLDGSIVNSSNVIARGYGLCCYIRKNDRDGNRKYNRRVEVRVQPRDQEGT